MWPRTKAGAKVHRSCPGGKNLHYLLPSHYYVMASAGNATRMCFEDGSWGEVNVTLCSSPEINNILNEVAERQTLRAKQPNLHSISISLHVKANELLPDANTKSVTSSHLEIAVNISEQLAIATQVEDETGLYPSDLDSTNQVVSKVSSETARYKRL